MKSLIVLAATLLAGAVLAVEVVDGDTPESLQKRIMEQVEWKIIQTLDMTVRQFEDLIHRETDGLIVRAVVKEQLN